MNQQITKAVMDKTTTVTSYATSGTVGLGGLMSSDWIMVYVGAFFALMTFLLNWWYQKRREHKEHLQRVEHDAREREFHAARMAALMRRSTDVVHQQER